MSRLIFTIISLVIAGIIIFSAGGIVLNGSSDPTMQKIFLSSQSQGLNQLLKEKEDLNLAIANAEKIKAKISDLEQAQASIDPADLAKLDKFIPSHIDNINLIIDANNIAADKGLTIKNVKVRADNEMGANPAAQTVADNSSIAAGQNRIAETYLSFSISGDYQNLIDFVDNLANSLQVADVTSLAFSVDEKGVNQYNFEIKTYWVK